MKIGRGWIAAAALGALHCGSIRATELHNVILFVPDGLRSQIVDYEKAPTMARLRDEGVNFRNSHSVFPTFTTANASAFSTGHLLGDTGDFSNVIFTGFPVDAAKKSVTPFLESDPILKEINAHFAGNYPGEDSIAALAAGTHSLALIGKLGPVAIFDVKSIDEQSAGPRTLILDDSTGNYDAAGALVGIVPPEDWRHTFDKAHRALQTPDRGKNGQSVTHTPNNQQQDYFLKVTLDVVLPAFKAANRPFYLVYWSRDPDGTQHNQGDSPHTLSPGINGPTSLAAIRSADDALASIESRLKELGLFDSTDIIVAADHGFSTISKASSSPAATIADAKGVRAYELPKGFLGIDLGIALNREDPAIKLFDPDNGNKPVDWQKGELTTSGNALLASDPTAPKVIVAANGGSDLIYLDASLTPTELKKLGDAIVRALFRLDYTSGIFVDEGKLGKPAGTLPLGAIGLSGSAKTPHPAIVVSFKSVATCNVQPLALCTAVIADTILQQGQGMHGSFSRADTWNFMAARGPDFRAGYLDPLPANNADIGMTIANLLGVAQHARGTLGGRVLEESFKAFEGKPLPKTESHVVQSAAISAMGLQTVKKTQTVGTHVYIDAAGFPGRTVGLE
jgi:hypothetical protein